MAGSTWARSTTPTNFEIGQPLDGSAIGVVLASTDPAIAEGAVVRHRMGWRDHAVIDASTATVIDADAAPVGAWLGVLGQTGFTAWAGLKRVGELREGDVVFISAAAGAVGSAAGRFAKLLGASRVVGSAGGAAKVAMLVDELGYDDAFDYRAVHPREGVPGVAPDGLDVYFDNVGGPHLVAALKNMHIGGRVALCGMISQYSPDGQGQDINHLIEAVLRRVTIRGFIVRDHEDMRPEFEQTRRRVAALRGDRGPPDRHRRHRPRGRRLPRHAPRRQRRQGPRPPRHRLDGLNVRRPSGDCRRCGRRAARSRSTKRRLPRLRCVASWLSIDASDVSISDTSPTAMTPASARASLPRAATTASRSRPTSSSRVSRRSASTSRLRPIELTKYTVAGVR